MFDRSLVCLLDHDCAAVSRHKMAQSNAPSDV